MEKPWSAIDPVQIDRSGLDDSSELHDMSLGPRPRGSSVKKKKGGRGDLCARAAVDGDVPARTTRALSSGAVPRAGGYAA